MTDAWREPSQSQPSKMVDVRCRDCGRLLFRIDAEKAKVETVCPDRRCKRFQTVTLRGKAS